MVYIVVTEYKHKATGENVESTLKIDEKFVISLVKSLLHEQISFADIHADARIEIARLKQ